uniref:RING-type domain-containing protein n=1 Tax=Leptobrachium leishanense TaxID=445787 RepID=A0A8C5PPF3_9ANUR
MKCKHCMDISQDHCSICLEDYDGRNSASQISCSHIFHSDCILMWLMNSATCPICRAEIRHAGPDTSKDCLNTSLFRKGKLYCVVTQVLTQD